MTTQQVLDERVVDAAGDVPRRSRRRTRRARERLGWFLLLAVGLVFVARLAPGMGDPFGYIPGGGGLPVDSYNDAVFSIGARAIRELGPIDSKLGGVWGGGDRYADHPPLIYSVTATSQWIVGDDELAARGVALIAAIATIVLLFLLLRVLGLPPPLAALSVGIGLSVPMFVAYGPMLDTLTIGLPFAVAYLLVWQRALDGRRPVALASAAAAAVLVAWEGAILVGLTILVTLVLRQGRRGLATVAAAAGGAAGGAALTIGWLLWVNGSFTRVLDQGLLRANGGVTISVGDYVDQQVRWLRTLFGVPALVLLALGLVAIVVVPRFRPAGIAALATTVVYAGVFRQGSWQHDYWNYWLVVPLVLGTGACALVVSRARWRPLAYAAAALAIAVVVTSFTAATTVYLRTDGRDRQPGLAATRRPVDGQRWVPVVSPDGGRPGTTAVWAMPQQRYYLRAPLRFAAVSEAVRYVRRHPTFWVIVDHEVVRGPEALARLGAA